MIRTPASSRCSSKASGGRRPSCMRPPARSKPASRSWRSRPAPPPSRRPRPPPTPASSAATMRPISPCASATASAIAARSTTWWRPRSPSRADGCRRDRASASSPPRAAPSISCSTTRKARARSSRNSPTPPTPRCCRSCRTASCRRTRSISAFPRRSSTPPSVCEVVARDPNVDMLGWAAMLPSKQGAWDGVEALHRLLSLTDKPVIGFGRMSYQMRPESVAAQEAAGFPFLQALEPTLRAMNALWFYASRQGRPPAPLPPAPASDLSPGDPRSDARALRHRAAGEPRGRDAPPRPRTRPRRSAFRSRSKSARPTSCTRPRPAACGSICAAARRSPTPPARSSPPRAPRMPDARIEGLLVQQMVVGRRGDRRGAQRCALRPVVVDRRRRRIGRARPRRGAAAAAGGGARGRRHDRGAAAQAAPRRLSRAPRRRPRRARAAPRSRSRNSISITAPASPISRSIR